MPMSRSSKTAKPAGRRPGLPQQPLAELGQAERPGADHLQVGVPLAADACERAAHQWEAVVGKRADPADRPAGSQVPPDRVAADLDGRAVAPHPRVHRAGEGGDLLAAGDDPVRHAEPCPVVARVGDRVEGVVAVVQDGPPQQLRRQQPDQRLQHRRRGVVAERRGDVHNPARQHQPVPVQRRQGLASPAAGPVQQAVGAVAGRREDAAGDAACGKVLQWRLAERPGRRVASWQYRDHRDPQPTASLQAWTMPSTARP
jgi:hypothetical protein